MASLSLMTACSGDKKADNANGEKENTEEVAEKTDEQQGDAETSDEAVANPADAKALDIAAIYANGDFKPGEVVVFSDNLDGEKDGEQPSKWDLKEGGVEVKACAGRNILSLTSESNTIAPLINGKSNFLTEAWNLEYEYFAANGAEHNIKFFNNEDEEISILRIYADAINYSFKKNNDEYIDGDNNLGNLINKGWNHLAVSYNAGNLKVFINGKRVVNLPNIKQPYSFNFWSFKGLYFTNIRVTK